MEDRGWLPCVTSYNGPVLGSSWLEMICTVGNLVPVYWGINERKERRGGNEMLEKEPQRWSDGLWMGNELSQME